MKVNKKVVVSTGAVLGVAALVAGGTIAYFTDTEETSNNFTVGKVDIALYESQLHRMNSGRKGIFDPMASDPNYCTYTHTGNDNNTGAGPQPTSATKTTYETAKYCTPGVDADNTSGISAITYGHTGRGWGFSDQDIIADAGNYKAGADTVDTSDDGYFTTVSKNIVPGQYIRKFAYVLNDNTNNNGSDAYVVIRYMVPEAYADKIAFDIPSSAYTESKADPNTKVANGNGYFTMLDKDADGKYVAANLANKDELKAFGGYHEGGYVVYAAVTTEALKPGEMTFWSPINTISIDKDEQQTESGSGIGDVSYSQAAISVKVDAQAIQAKTFENAIEAVNKL